MIVLEIRYLCDHGVRLNIWLCFSGLYCLQRRHTEGTKNTQRRDEVGGHKCPPAGRSGRILTGIKCPCNGRRGTDEAHRTKVEARGHCGEGRRETSDSRKRKKKIAERKKKIAEKKEDSRNHPRRDCAEGQERERHTTGRAIGKGYP